MVGLVKLKMKKVKTINAKIYLGLRKGYGESVHTLDEVKNFLQEYVDKAGLCFTISPTTFVYSNGREEGAVIGLVNYPRFPKTKRELEILAEEIAELCKDRFNQERISIEYQGYTMTI